jgi:hypothetical protein
MTSDSLRHIRIGALLAIAGCVAYSAFGTSRDFNLPVTALFFCAVVALPILSWRLRTLELKEGKPAAPTERGLAFVAMLAASWALIDAFILSQGAIAVVLAAIAVFYLFPRAIPARRDRRLLRLRLGKAGLTLLAGVIAFGVIRLNNSLAARRAESIIAAVEQFRSQSHRYPDSLQELVPAYLEDVPRPKIVLVSDGRGFVYSSNAGGHSLAYTSIPPYGRRAYSFERHAWAFID